MECIWLIVVAEARRTAGKSAFVEVVANSSK
jgi:ERCC4-related helicase